MTRYIIRRVLLIGMTLLIISVLVFAGLRMLAGDLAIMMLGRAGIAASWERLASPEALDALRQELGLGDPVPVQYLKWLRLVLKGNFGVSAYSRNPVLPELLEKIPVTVQLALMSSIIAWVLGVPIGLLAAWKQDTALDGVVRMFSVMGLAIPSFWLGALLITLPAIWWGWTPLKPYVSIGTDLSTNLSRMFWPALVLGVGMNAWLMRMTRATMVEVMQQDYVRTARAKGLAERVVLGRHALKNALIPVLATGGLQFGGLLGGTIAIEQMFSVPGIGRWLVTSITYRDYAVVQVCVLFITVGYCLVLLGVDILYAWLDPRIRYT